MKNSSILRLIAFAGIMVITLFNATQTIAQDNDILDLCTQPKYNCNTTGDIEIPFNFDGALLDSIVVIQNISGFRQMDIGPTDKNY